MNTALSFQMEGMTAPVNVLSMTTETSEFLQSLKPKYSNPREVSVKPVYADMLRGALENFNALGNGQLYNEVVATFERSGYENLTIYYGLILRKEGDLQLLSSLAGEERVSVYGHSIPLHVAIYAAIMAAALDANVSAVANRHTQITVRMYMKSIARNLSHSILARFSPQ